VCPPIGSGWFTWENCFSMINRSTHTVKIKANTVKGDDQTVHLMAKVDNQNPPSNQPNAP
jgi:hypothetical protein